MLSGDQISRIRIALGLSQREAASLFGGGYNAFNKYESGEVLQSFAMDRLLRLASVIGPEVISLLSSALPTPANSNHGSKATISRDLYFYIANFDQSASTNETAPASSGYSEPTAVQNGISPMFYNTYLANPIVQQQSLVDEIYRDQEHLH